LYQSIVAFVSILPISYLNQFSSDPNITQKEYLQHLELFGGKFIPYFLRIHREAS